MDIKKNPLKTIWFFDELKKILNLLLKGALYFIDALLLFNKLENKKTENILIVRIDAIGDFVLWLDSAQYLKKFYPNKKIILLGNRVWTNLAKKFPFWDEVWELDRLKFKQNLLYRINLLKKIQKAGFDVVIETTYSREFLYGDSIARISGAREKIGSVGDCSNILPIEKKISDQFYTLLIPANPQSLMELKRNAEFMCGLWISMKADMPDLSFALREIENPLDNINDYYVLFPGAGWSGRQWPITRFAALSNKIYRQCKFTTVICGGRDEESLAESLLFQIDVPVINMTGKTNLVELAVIIKGASFLVGNETSAIHFAAAVSTPAFCILGGGHYGRFIPYDIKIKTERPLPVSIIHKMDCFNCNWHCCHPHKKNAPVPCIEKISVKRSFCRASTVD